MPLPRPQGVAARAVLPVLGGAAVLAAIMGSTWGIAAWISRGGAESTTRLAPETLPVGNVEAYAESIADRGPILFPGLNTSSGERSLVLHHTGDDPTRGWHVYLAYPDGGDPSCGVRQIPETQRFTDCDGNELDVTELASAPDACPIVENRETLSVGLTAARCRAIPD